MTKEKIAGRTAAEIVQSVRNLLDLGTLRPGDLLPTVREVADALGDDHDLAMMAQLMEREPDLFGAPETREQLQRCIQQRREQLQQRALRLGRRLYAEGAKALVTRMAAYWCIARAERG